MSLFFNKLCMLVIAFLPRSKRLLISWLQSPSAVILEPKKITSFTVSIVSPSICQEVMGLHAMILAFKPAFSRSSFTSSRGSLVPVHFLPWGWCHLHIWGYWDLSWQSWFQLVFHPRGFGQVTDPPWACFFFCKMKITSNSQNVAFIKSMKRQTLGGFPGGAAIKNSPANAGDTRRAGSILGSGKSPAVGNGSPLQYSCLENPMDRGTWRATVHGVTKSWTQLSDWANAAHQTLSLIEKSTFNQS